jgi:hypothetical protein
MGLVSSTLALCAAPLQQRECAEPEVRPLALSLS